MCSEQLDGDTFREQVREARRTEFWRRLAFVSLSAGIVLTLAIVGVEAVRTSEGGGGPWDRWLVAAIIPLLLLPAASALYWAWHIRRYLQLMKVTGRAVTPADVGTGVWRIETFMERFVATKWWRMIVIGIFTVVIGYKLVRLFTG